MRRTAAEAALARDVGGLRRPRRDRAEPRRDQDLAAAGARMPARRRSAADRASPPRQHRAPRSTSTKCQNRADVTRASRLNGRDARIELVEAERGQGDASGNSEDRHAPILPEPGRRPGSAYRPLSFATGPSTPAGAACPRTGPHRPAPASGAATRPSVPP